MAKAPVIGDRVKYLGSRLVPEGFVEDPKRMERTGEVVPSTDPSGVPVTTEPGTWPVNVKWDNDDPVQTCYENEIKLVESSDENGSTQDVVEDFPN